MYKWMASAKIFRLETPQKEFKCIGIFPFDYNSFIVLYFLPLESAEFHTEVVNIGQEYEKKSQNSLRTCSHQYVEKLVVEELDTTPNFIVY